MVRLRINNVTTFLKYALDLYFPHIFVDVYFNFTAGTGTEYYVYCVLATIKCQFDLLLMS